MHCSTNGDEEEEGKHIRRHEEAGEEVTYTCRAMVVGETCTCSAAAPCGVVEDTCVPEVVVEEICICRLGVVAICVCRQVVEAVETYIYRPEVVEICAYYKVAKPCEEAGICAHREVGVEEETGAGMAWRNGKTSFGKKKRTVIYGTEVCTESTTKLPTSLTVTYIFRLSVSSELYIYDDKLIDKTVLDARCTCSCSYFEKENRKKKQP